MPPLDDTSEQGSESVRSDKSTHISGEPIPVTSAEMRTAGEAEPFGRIVEYDAAISRRAASFVQLGGAVFYSQEKFSGDPVGRAVFGRYIAPLTEAFEAVHGAITHAFYCRGIIAAAVLTARHELCIIHPAFDSKETAIADMLFECDRLNVESDRVLAGPGRSKDLQATKMLLYAVVVRLLSVLDPPMRPFRTIVDLHRRELGKARDYYLRAAVRYAKFDYFLGMLIGVILCFGIIAISASVLVRYVPDLEATGKTLVGCLTAGAIGAVVSVLSRMTFGDLELDYDAGRRILTMLGAFRPVIGMVLGAAMWVLFESGVLAVGPSDPAKMPFFHILIAFLAGFSERWAQDMLGRAAHQISGHDATGKRARGKVGRTIKVTSGADGGV